MGDDKLEPPVLKPGEQEIKPGYKVRVSTDLEITKIAHEVGQSKNHVVDEFLLWAIDAYRRGYRP